MCRWQHWQECQATFHACGQTNAESSLFQCFCSKRSSGLLISFPQEAGIHRTVAAGCSTDPSEWRWLVSAGTELYYFAFSRACGVHPYIWWSKRLCMHAHPTCRIWSHEEEVSSGQCIEVPGHQLALHIYIYDVQLIYSHNYTNIGSPRCSIEEWTSKCWNDGHHGWASQVRAEEDSREVIWHTCRWKRDSLQRGLSALHPFWRRSADLC